MGNDKLLTTTNALGAAEIATSFVPGVYGRAAELTVAYFSGSHTGKEDYSALSQALGVSLATLKSSPAVRLKIQELEGRWGEKVKDVAVSGAGALAGGAIGQTLIPIPFVGAVVGTAAGGMVTSYLFSGSGKKSFDVVTAAAEWSLRRKNGEKIPPEAASAILMGALNESDQKKIMDEVTDELRKNSAKGVNKDPAIVLNEVLAREGNDLKLAAAAGLPTGEMLPDGTFKTAGAQLADMINNKNMPVANLLDANKIRLDMAVAKERGILLAAGKQIPDSPQQSPAFSGQGPRSRV